MGKLASERYQTFLDFDEARDDRVLVASAGPYANHLPLAPDGNPCQHIITQFLQDGWMDGF